MQFKHCKYYKKSEEQEHCAFSCCCDIECIFTLKGSLQKIQELEKELEDFENKKQQCDDLQDELDSYSDDLNKLECENTELLMTIVNLINENKIKNYKEYIDRLDNEKYIQARITL